MSLQPRTGKEFAAHNTVIHSKNEYVRGNVHTNTVENVWSVFKRGMKDIYQHCGEAHLPRYLAEFDFRTIAAQHSVFPIRNAPMMQSVELLVVG